MKRLAIILFSLFVSIVVIGSDSTSIFVKGIGLKDVVVYGKRPLKEIGTSKTTFDSTMLKENIAQSMADVLTQHSSLFVKSYGRATLSTVSFRGTSPQYLQGAEMYSVMSMACQTGI